jgi:hypothetical protein
MAGGLLCLDVLKTSKREREEEEKANLACSVPWRRSKQQQRENQAKEGSLLGGQ